MQFYKLPLSIKNQICIDGEVQSMSASLITFCSRVSSVKRKVSNHEISRNMYFIQKQQVRFKLAAIWIIAAWWSNWTFFFILGSNFSFCVKFQCQFWTQRPLRKVTGDMVVCFLTKPPHLTSRPGNAILVRLNWQFMVSLTLCFMRQWDNYETFELKCGKGWEISWCRDGWNCHMGNLNDL